MIQSKLSSEAYYGGFGIATLACLACDSTPLRINDTLGANRSGTGRGHRFVSVPRFVRRHSRGENRRTIAALHAETPSDAIVARTDTKPLPNAVGTLRTPQTPCEDVSWRPLGRMGRSTWASAAESAILAPGGARSPSQFISLKGWQTPMKYYVRVFGWLFLGMGTVLSVLSILDMSGLSNPA